MITKATKSYNIGDQVKIIDKDSKYASNTGIVVASRVKDGDTQYLVWYLNGEDKQAIFTIRQMRAVTRVFSKTIELARKCTSAEDFVEKDNREN